MDNNHGEFILYQTEDGQTRIDVRMENDTVWLTQAQMAELFQRDRSVISKHIKNVFEEHEVDEKSNVQNLHVANSDKPVSFYSLDVIISVGYRVKSLRGTQFRIWANSVLREYLIKGFAMNDELLKKAGGGGYFDELLERIRDIRSSEKVFWRKVLDIYATSIDYSPDAAESTFFFQTVQNKMLQAASGRTAAELIYSRADATLPLMGMTSYKGSRPTLSDAKIAKNYLQEDELQTLNYLVSAYLDLAELQAMRHQPMYMKDWVTRLDDFLRMTGSEIMNHVGRISRETAEQKARAEFQIYKRNRDLEPSVIERDMFARLEDAEKALKAKKK